MSEFVSFLHEVFEQFGAIESKRMFGGYGIYHQGLMFGLVADDVLYLKADTESVGYFAELGLEPFQYAKQGKLAKINYYQAPDEIFDDPDQARIWAMRAFETALRAKSTTKK